MDVNNILAGLNDAQREAVTSEAHALRVIAGAGSGKTRVLVQRMQWLMHTLAISPYALLALTFTNKAAREMRQRLESALDYPLGQLWMGTFHGICHRILRRHAPSMNWPAQFVIMDTDDQLQLVKRLMRARHWDESQMQARQMVWQINQFKEAALRADDVPMSTHPVELAIRDFYREYEHVCRQQGVMDFAELLLLTVELLDTQEAIRQEYQTRFRSILVDEFQDTNGLQFRLVELLCAGGATLFVVGDDDQSIYGWRGARVENILHLEQHFPTLQTIRLEQNYRSTQTILNAANAVIAQNTSRLGKTLWSGGHIGERVAIYPALNEYDEARYVTEQIERWVAQGAGRHYQDCVVLYRSNAQSRVFEELFLQHRVPYRVYGGLRFFERAEIKDALAYLHLTQQPNNDGALERIINTPPRGIGAKTVAQLRELAQTANSSMWVIIREETLLTRHFNGRASKALANFANLIHKISEQVAATTTLQQALHIVIQQSGLLAMYETSKKEDSEARRDNLNELINAGSYIDVNHHDSSNLIMDFLVSAALDAGDGQEDAGSDAVQLMTLHSAKGLEFPNVFIVGMEEGLCPSARALDKPQQLEEERRLVYVGMTRAQQQLTLCFAERRRFQGQEMYPQPSRFIHEIPEEYVTFVRPIAFSHLSYARYAPSGSASQHDSTEFKIGDKVGHHSFGEGCIVKIEGRGKNTLVLIDFPQVGEKWLVLSYAPLKRI